MGSSRKIFISKSCGEFTQSNIEKWTLFALLMTMLPACGATGGGTLRTFDRPPDFPSHVLFQAYDSGRGKRWCVIDDDYLRETQHIIHLNHVIDRYECQVVLRNGAKECDLPKEER